MNIRGYVKPIKYYVDVDRIFRFIQQIPLEKLLAYLGNYGVLVWRVAPNLFIVIDHETKHKDLRRVSIISIPLDEDYLLQLALEVTYNVKLYTEQDLRRILRGLLIHQEYGNAIGFLLPCEYEVRVIDRSKGIVGIADIVCGEYVLEVKSSHSSRREHVYQLLLYMDMLRKTHGFLVYMDKVFEFSLNDNLDLLSEAYRKIHEIYNIVHSLANNLTSYKDKFLRKFGMKVNEIIERLNNLDLV